MFSPHKLHQYIKQLRCHFSKLLLGTSFGFFSAFIYQTAALAVVRSNITKSTQESILGQKYTCSETVEYPSLVFSSCNGGNEIFKEQPAHPHLRLRHIRFLSDASLFVNEAMSSDWRFFDRGGINGLDSIDPKGLVAISMQHSWECSINKPITIAQKCFETSFSLLSKQFPLSHRDLLEILGTKPSAYVAVDQLSKLQVDTLNILIVASRIASPGSFTLSDPFLQEARARIIKNIKRYNLSLYLRSSSTHVAVTGKGLDVFLLRKSSIMRD